MGLLKGGNDLTQILELVGVWFSGLATLSAALVALFLPRLYRPRLSVTCNKEGIGSSSFLFTDSPSASEVAELWIKVGVKNSSGLNADDVQLRLIMVRDESSNGRRAYTLFSSWWLKVSALNIVSISIPPKYTQYYDLCYLVVNRDRKRGALHLVAVRPPLDEWEIEKPHIESDPKRTLFPGREYGVIFAVAGRNTHAGYYRISIAYDVPRDGFGLDTDENALRNSIRVSQPERVSPGIEADEFPAV